jgi:ribosomal protein S18 acetylase RimI-like enzyme
MSRRAAIDKAQARDPMPPKNKPCYELIDIAVLPSWQGYGIGTMLMQWVMNRGIEDGVLVVRVRSAMSNSMRA